MFTNNEINVFIKDDILDEDDSVQWHKINLKQINALADSKAIYLFTTKRFKN